MDWEIQKAEDFCVGVTDGTHDSPKGVESGRYLITSKHLGEYEIDFSSAKLISEEDYKKVISRSKVAQWDILFSMIGTIGNTYLEKNETVDYACKNMGIFQMGGDKEKAYWLYYYLKSPQACEYIASQLRGSTQQYVPLGGLRACPIPVPNEAIRRKIVEILKVIDEKINTNNKINRNLSAQVAAIYKAWFVDFKTNNGICPDDWKDGILGDIAEISSGKRPPMKQNDKTDDVCIPLVGAASIMGYTNAILYDSKILVTGRVGTHGVVQRFDQNCWPSDNTLVITTDRYEFVNQILLGVDYESINRGSTQPLITQGDLKKIEIIVPNDAVLDEFENLAGGLMSQYEKNVKENAKLSELRDSLLPKLMSGELDVSEMDL